MPSNSHRPFFRSKASELRTHADAHWSDLSALESVATELTYRSSNAAQSLAARISKRITELNLSAPATVEPPPPPEHAPRPQVPVHPTATPQVAPTRPAATNRRGNASADKKDNGIFPFIFIGSIVAFFAFALFRDPPPKPKVDPFKANVIQNHDVHVDGYTKANGTYVKPHARTQQNHTKSDNFSTKGNTNFYTGKRGTR